MGKLGVECRRERGVDVEAGTEGLRSQGILEQPHQGAGGLVLSPTLSGDPNTSCPNTLAAQTGLKETRVKVRWAPSLWLNFTLHLSKSYLPWRLPT